MMQEVTVYVSGKPRPQPRARHILKGRKVVPVSTADEGVKKYRAAVERACRSMAQQLGHDPKSHDPKRRDLAYEVELRFWFHTKDDRRWGDQHIDTPDADNLAKLWMDCASKAGLWHDDRQVYRLTVTKTWSMRAAAMMTITPREIEGETETDEEKCDLGAESVENVD